MNRQTVIITFDINEEARRGFAEGIGDIANLVFLSEVPKSRRRAFIKDAAAAIVFKPSQELSDDEIEGLDGKLIQSFTAGVETFPFEKIPNTAIISHNGGAFAEPMAEYVVGVILNCFRELRERHDKLVLGEWDQLSPTRMLKGATCAIIGYGSIGRQVSRLMQPFGVEIHGINRRGVTDDNIDFVGTLADVEKVIRIADIVVLALGLNKQTKNLFNSKKFEWLKSDAVVINVARGNVIEQKAFYEWLVAHPKARGCIDAWWREPINDGDFDTEYPFLSLPNVFGSPHNSAIVYGAYEYAARHAAINVKSYLELGSVQRLVTVNDRP